jgi:hypothetical protein
MFFFLIMQLFVRATDRATASSFIHNFDLFDRAFCRESAPRSCSRSFDCGGIPHLDTVLFLRNPSS